MKEYYEGYWNPAVDVSEHDVTTPARMRRLLATMRKYCRPGARVLDLGCGAGSFSAALHRHGYDVIGLDIAENAVELARQTYPQVCFQVLRADGTIPAPDQTFAAVWSSEVIEHVFDVGAYLREIHRVLQPNGLLVLTTPHHGLIKNLGIVLVKFERHFNVQGNHIRYFTKPALDRCLTEGGFQPLAYGGVGRFWPVYRTWFVTAKRAA
jgi:2-polyprenyl-6-hydroxyphenyl methylase/3-demethylubiquinone-9 3-methyltransferase